MEEAAVESFLRGVQPIEAAGKLGVLLLQLSPGFSPRNNKLEELDQLLQHLAPRTVAVELRNRNWVEGEQLEHTTDYLKQHKAVYVGVDTPKSEHFNVMPPIDLITNPAVSYLRLHGRNERGYVSGRSVAERFDYNYSDEELEEVKGRVESLAGETKVVHVIYNNNRSDYAPSAALRFRRMLGQAVPDEAFEAKPKQRSLDL
jgi:uncharacterized protein YecE (DUF72 family)